MKAETGCIIGLKYCGGCNPRYDRVALVRHIQRALGRKAAWARADHPEVQIGLVVQGCPTACADLTPFGGLEPWVMVGPGAAERFIDHVRAIVHEKEDVDMQLSREEIRNALKIWNLAWAQFDLNGVMALMHDDVLFENWTGGCAVGKQALGKAWGPWFAKGGFHFAEEELFIDETAQKVLFRWTLQWPSMEKGFEGQVEKRKGVDVMHFKDGKIINKLTFSQTTVEIDGRRHTLHL